MPPSNLQGLNLIHPPPAPPSDADGSDLMSSPLFPDFSEQLDLWSTLSFQNTDPIDDYPTKPPPSTDDLNDDPVSPEITPVHDTPNTVDFPGDNGVSLPTQPALIDNLLSGFNPGFPISNAQSSLLLSNSLAHLLALQNAAFAPVPNSAEPASRQNETPPSKRTRTRKSSASTIDESEKPDTTPLTAAEDKRRRNTAASARFRLKKKEREAALESKAKELERKVTELERECEALRRENGWLKGLVVGVTGAAQQPGAAKTATTLMTTPKDESQRER